MRSSTGLRRSLITRIQKTPRKGSKSGRRPARARVWAKGRSRLHWVLRTYGADQATPDTEAFEVVCTNRHFDRSRLHQTPRALGAVLLGVLLDGRRVLAVLRCP
jgi:hypothetical protein